MTRIRKVEISNFRGIGGLIWCPASGINCLVGPGDSGKSTILNAIDLCLGFRQNFQFTDIDFHLLNVESPITISVTFGELDEKLKNLEAFGMYLRGFVKETGDIEDEPEKEAETVLTMTLTVTSDLEPSWSLVSERAEALGQQRNLSWNDRAKVAPSRIGVVADYHLGWRRGSVLNRVSEQRADASAALAKAGRQARAVFGDEAQNQLGETLGIVESTARELGVPVGENLRAMLDAHSVSFSGGTISVHNEDGVPLRGLGIGSARLLIAGLQRKAASSSTIILVDEVEYGLEPHRIIRFLGSLGTGEDSQQLQVFMTTHSPVVLRELSSDQLFITRPGTEKHEILAVGGSPDIQGTIRLFPEAFLATSVILCEGASEVGLVRGLDNYRMSNCHDSICAHGTVLVDCGGGGLERLYKRAETFLALGYRSAVFRDADRKPDEQIEERFTAGGGTVFAWRDGRAVEDELFLSLTDEAVAKLIMRAVEIHGADLVNDHIKSTTQNSTDLPEIQAEVATGSVASKTRAVLGKAAKTKRRGWFKSITWMEGVGHEIVGPDLEGSDTGFRLLIDAIFSWAGNAVE